MVKTRMLTRIPLCLLPPAADMVREGARWLGPAILLRLCRVACGLAGRGVGPLC